MFSRSVKSSSSYLQNIDVGPVVAKIQGSVRELGQQYKDATVALYNKQNLQPLAIRKPDQAGNYQFLGLNTNLKTFIMAFDKQHKFNAIIQDNVRPK